MQRLFALTAIFALALTVTACGGKQKKEEAPVVETATTPAPPAAPATPTCGGWIVYAEIPVVPAGSFSADGLQRAFLAGLQSGNCTGVTAVPAGATAPVLKVSLKASAAGAGGILGLTATDNGTGELKWRFQEKVAAGGDGSAAANGLGMKIAAALGS